MEKTNICKVKNKSSGLVSYSIPEIKLTREFALGEEKKISVDELEMLSHTRGGRNLLANYLQVQSEELITELLNRQVEPEYWLTQEQIPTWMESCSLDEFKDALDFAPEGTKDLIKQYAVSKNLTDNNKREAIKNQLGFDVTKAIELNHAYDEDKGESAAAGERRVKPTTESTGRRAAASTIQKPATVIKKPE